MCINLWTDVTPYTVMDKTLSPQTLSYFLIFLEIFVKSIYKMIQILWLALLRKIFSFSDKRCFDFRPSGRSYHNFHLWNAFISKQWIRLNISAEMRRLLVLLISDDINRKVYKLWSSENYFKNEFWYFNTVVCRPREFERKPRPSKFNRTSVQASRRLSK